MPFAGSKFGGVACLSTGREAHVRRKCDDRRNTSEPNGRQAARIAGSPVVDAVLVKPVPRQVLDVAFKDLKLGSFDDVLASRLGQVISEEATSSPG